MVLTWQLVLSVCAGFVCVVTALEKIQEIYKKSKQPVEDVSEKLKRDYDRINALEAENKAMKTDVEYIANAVSILMQCDLVMLGHMKTNNNTGQITKMESDLQNFIADNLRGVHQ
jgi:hypothetical protein